MAMFAGVGRGIIEIGANRGVSGIDGTIASAAGYAAGLSRPVTLLIGDLGCLHDLNSLALLNRIAQPVTIVILNNDGGGIFELRPVVHFKELCEQYFVTPHGLSFQNAAAMYNLPYTAVGINRADGIDAFAQAYSEATACARSSIIELTTDRRTNVDLYHRIQQTIIGGVDNI
jgi:2-succinyl-5-enolpyruvyl-6-hydroxy-3-cyclohexene-1-carboxylate synthase